MDTNTLENVVLMHEVLNKVSSYNFHKKNTGRDIEIFLCRTMHGMTYDEIGREFGIHKSRASSICKRFTVIFKYFINQ